MSANESGNDYLRITDFNELHEIEALKEALNAAELKIEEMFRENAALRARVEELELEKLANEQSTSASQNSSPSTTSTIVEQSQADLQITNAQLDISIEIGEGAFGTVRRGKFGDRRVALKFSTNEEDADLLRNEYDILKELDNPYIIKVIDLVKYDNQDVLILPIFATNLREFLENNPVEESLKCDFTLQIARALDYLNERAIVHMDIKLENILIADCQRKTVIADFGLSKTVRGELHDTQGTLLYNAPEKVLLHPSFGTKSDIWSFGCVVFELFDERQNHIFEAQDAYDFSKLIFDQIYIERRIMAMRSPEQIRRILKGTFKMEQQRISAETIVAILEDEKEEQPMNLRRGRPIFQIPSRTADRMGKRSLLEYLYELTKSYSYENEVGAETMLKVFKRIKDHSTAPIRTLEQHLTIVVDTSMDIPFKHTIEQCHALISVNFLKFETTKEEIEKLIVFCAETVSELTARYQKLNTIQTKKLIKELLEFRKI